MDGGEPDIISHLHSIESTYFYQIHGLVQNWWDHWIGMNGGLTKRLKDSKDLIKEKELHKESLADTKDFIKEHKDAIKDTKEHKEFVKDIIKDHKEFLKEASDGNKRLKEKDKDKDLIEHKSAASEVFNPNVPLPDPAILHLQERIAELEKAAGMKGTAFIKPKERPAVGKKKTDDKG